jgi:hypothetical protein
LTAPASAGTRLRPILLALALGAAALSVGGCAGIPRPAFTAAEQAVASPVGFGRVRYVEDDPDLARLMGLALKPDPAAQDGGQVDALALSGGGANGAYGAGVIYGWTAAGQRPRFQVVTGVSTGALAAPFAFLGPAWDEPLRRTYFGDPIHHLMQRRGLMGLLGDGFYRKSPLEALVRGYVTDDLLAAVAAEQARGRRLLVATTNLDTEQLIVWDMGAIAAQGGPKARELFAEVLIASASVPGVFPPTLIPVQSGARRFSEMHVDGQTESPFFAITQRLLFAAPDAGGPRVKPRLFIIVNGPRESRFLVTPRATIPILSRTLDAAGKASIRSALAEALEFCRVNGCDVRVSDLPPGETDSTLDFRAAHVEHLFAAGQDAIRGGRAWTTAAPLAPRTPEAAPKREPDAKAGTERRSPAASALP